MNIEETVKEFQRLIDGGFISPKAPVVNYDGKELTDVDIDLLDSNSSTNGVFLEFEQFLEMVKNKVNEKL